MSDVAWSWFGPGHVTRLVALGRRVIAPDLRGHSSSDAPHDEAAYASDALARDLEALLSALGVGTPDVAAYSLGARTAIRWMLRGARPRRAVLGGIGDTLVFGSPLLRVERFDRLLATQGRSGLADDAATWAWMTHGGFDPRAMRALAAGLVPITADELASIDVPVRLVIGADDRSVGSATRLAALLPRASLAVIPGDHVQAGLSAAFGATIAEHVAS